MSIFNKAYSTQEAYFKGIPGFAHRTTIDPKNHSPRGMGAQRTYSPGISRAIALFLTGETTYQTTSGGASRISYESSSQGRITVSMDTTPGDIVEIYDNHATPFDHPNASGMVLIACALTRPDLFPDTYSGLQQLASLTNYPTTKADLLTLARNNPAFKDMMHRLIDHLYSEATEMLSNGKLKSIGAPSTVTSAQVISTPQIAAILGLTQATDGGEGESVQDKIMRLCERGGAAMLVGPPGTFKTTTIRKAAVALNANFVEMRGSPGVDDRDLFGYHMRGPDGCTTWVDGPLPRAFALAREGLTVALVDEALRFLPETLNVFITTLNELDYEDAALLLRPALLACGQTPDTLDQALSEYLPEKGERYYMLSMTNGETLFAMKKRLCWLYTTNFGDDHLQTAANFDAALESRFEMIIEVERADRDVVLPIYEQLAGRWQNLAAFAMELEDETHRQIDDAEGLFRRPLDPRKTMAFIRDARVLLERGETMRGAVTKASANTVTPHVCPRESNGRLNPSAVERINEIMFKELLPQFAS